MSLKRDVIDGQGFIVYDASLVLSRIASLSFNLTVSKLIYTVVNVISLFDSASIIWLNTFVINVQIGKIPTNLFKSLKLKVGFYSWDARQLLD